MKNSVKGWIFGGVAGSSIMILMLGMALFNFQREFIQQIWQENEGVTDKKPTNAYEKFDVRGFQVLIDKDLMDHPEQSKPLLKQLDTTLLKISQLVSPTQFAELKKTKIWVSVERHRRINETASEEAGHSTQAIAVYRGSSAQELKSHSHNPDKAKSVEIFNAKLFGRAPTDLQLTIVLHELAHAYHDKVLDPHNPAIRDAYKKAMARGRYNIADARSETAGRAYAATNDHEYFAELTVAYLTKNDGFPQDRYVLAKVDPIGYALMQQIWGPPK
jgi:hypothetical protein